ncbi:hypothetical protein QKD39_gp07 [Psittacine adenovirus 1]|uniref:Uncharacterized protein n=1 Tax=Psittacine adenovirus 1 TaxID=318592 RepID=A0A2Z5E060_9ADEN|nr:hypothetical protein QKD39_gp07 [Psittacine adenovirus 1]AXB73045.1 hypothetical protein [Psittacine adenovirus 1]
MSTSLTRQKKERQKRHLPQSSSAINSNSSFKSVCVSPCRRGGSSGFGGGMVRAGYSAESKKLGTRTSGFGSAKNLTSVPFTRIRYAVTRRGLGASVCITYSTTPSSPLYTQLSRHTHVQGTQPSLTCHGNRINFAPFRVQ